MTFLLVVLALPACALQALTLPAWAQMPSGLREVFLPQVRQEAAQAGVPPEVADAVAVVESGYHPEAVGTSGEIGIMQILPSTAEQLGFHGSLTELREPAINIHLAVQYLSRAWAQSGGDICRALTKYRAGLGEDVTSPLSAQYCSRAMSWLMGGSGRAGLSAVLAGDGAGGSDPHVLSVQNAMAVQTQMQVLGPPKQASELYYAPLVAQRMPAPVGLAMPGATAAQGISEPSARRRSAARIAALQATLDSHTRIEGTQATTSFDSGN